MTAGPWKDRAEFEEWWKANGREVRRMSVTDREEFERIARQVEAFNARNRR